MIHPEIGELNGRIVDITKANEVNYYGMRVIEETSGGIWVAPTRTTAPPFFLGWVGIRTMVFSPVVAP